MLVISNSRPLSNSPLLMCLLRDACILLLHSEDRGTETPANIMLYGMAEMDESIFVVSFRYRRNLTEKAVTLHFNLNLTKNKNSADIYREL